MVLVDDEATTMKRLVAEGVALADAGKFDEACAKFLEAFRIKPMYDVAGDLGGVELEAHRYRDAAEHLSYSLREYPPTGEPVIKADTQKKLALARAEVAAVRLHASVAGAVLKIDGATKGVAPIDHELYVEAGSHGFDAVLPGYKPAHVQRTVEKNKEALVDLLLVKDEAPSSDGKQPDGRGGSARIPLIVTGAVLAAGGLGAGVGLTVMYNSKTGTAKQLGDDLVADHGPSPCFTAPGDPRCGDAHNAFGAAKGAQAGAIASYAIGGVGAVLLVVGLALPAPQRKAGSITLAPLISRELRGLLEAFRVKPTYDVAGDLGRMGGMDLALHRYRDACEHLSYSLREYPPTGDPAEKADTRKKLDVACAEVAAVRLHASARPAPR